MATERQAEISGFVLAGGHSCRLGQDKALLPWPGQGSGEGNSQTLLDHAIARLGRLCNTVSICADRADLHRAETIIPDALPGSGPLGGIVAALEQTMTEWNIFLAVDLPFLPVEVFEALVVRVQARKKNATVRASSLEKLVCVLPQVGGLEQPLCGLYRRCLAPGLRQALDEGNFKITAALREAVRNPAPKEERQLGSPGFRIELWDAVSFAATMKPSPLLDPSEWFLNINTPEDWRRTQQRRSQ
ncbi:MAG: molybdenum cofactor guanylyltransferase [Acidobacteriaceae bacterium]